MVQNRNIEIRDDCGELLNPTLQEIMMAWGHDYTIRHLGDEKANELLRQAGKLIDDHKKDVIVRKTYSE